VGTVIENASWKARVIATAAGPKVSTTACSWPAAPCGATRTALRPTFVVAAAQQSQETRLCYLHIAVEEGERLWTPVFQVYGDMDLGNIEAARPWLHAIKTLGDEFFEAGWYDDARDAYEHLLAMDPGDHLGATDNLNQIGPRLVHSA